MKTILAFVFGVVIGIAGLLVLQHPRSLTMLVDQLPKKEAPRSCWLVHKYSASSHPCAPGEEPVTRVTRPQD
jgi:hypothetical protein